MTFAITSIRGSTHLSARLVQFLAAVAASILLAACSRPETMPVARAMATEESAHPNILIILADDLGYSDIGPYGGEISTPNLDRLANEGVRLTHFHSAPSCSPSRAMLLSGADIHTAGLGTVPEFIPPALQGREGFEGYLTNRVATVAERLKDAGYETMMAGKWHMGAADGQRPAQRGFDHSFALLQGAHDHFGDGGFAGPDDADYLLDDRDFVPGDDFYSSDAWAGWIGDQLAARDSAKPFFAFLSFTAPHSPLQAPPEDIAAQAGRYDEGWAKLSARRLAAMKSAGVLPGELPPEGEREGPTQASWDALTAEQKAVETRNMEIYAAMVANMDRNIGQVLDGLRASGQLDNTMVIFLSDNGPAGELAQTYAVIPGFQKRYSEAKKDLDQLGLRGSFVLRSPNWALASAAPSRLFKGFVTEGGTLIPAIVRYPGLPADSRNPVIGDLRDLLPTILDVANIAESSLVGGREVAVIEGRTMLPWLRSGKSDRPMEEVAFDQLGQATVRWGRWKLMRMPPPGGNGQWTLHDTIADPGERVDLSDREPAIRERLLDAYEQYRHRHGLPDVEGGLPEGALSGH